MWLLLEEAGGLAGSEVCKQRKQIYSESARVGPQEERQTNSRVFPLGDNDSGNTGVNDSGNK